MPNNPMNFYETELAQLFADDIAIEAMNVFLDSNEYFSKLAEHYPFLGSKINWAALLGSIELTENRSDFQIQSFCAFFHDVSRRYDLDAVFVYVGDSVTDFSLESKKEVFEKNLSSIGVSPCLLLAIIFATPRHQSTHSRHPIHPS
jgi:hypothetical protein